MPLIATFSSHVYGSGEILDQKFVFRVIGGQVCDLGIGITWVQVSRLPMPHPDNDQWKCTMFTNKYYISAHYVSKILQMNVFIVVNNTI